MSARVRPPQIFAFADCAESCPKYWLTSAAAERAACIEAVPADATGFHRLSLLLQYTSDERLAGARPPRDSLRRASFVHINLPPVLFGGGDRLRGRSLSAAHTRGAASSKE